MSSTTMRVVGVDVARGLAILGMFVAHAAPNPGDVELLADGRSSILFATLAGVSLGIMTGGTDPRPPGERSSQVQRIVMRALVLFVLGVALSLTGSGIAIILDYYAIMFLLLLPVLFLPRGALAVIGAILIFASPALAGLVGEPQVTDGPIVSILSGYLLTGYYPVLIWLPYLIAGLICSRSGLSRARVQLLMIVGGALVSVLGYGSAALLPGVTAEAHSDSTAEVLGSGGLAIAVIGTLLWLTSPERGGFGRVIRLVTWPIAAIGAMALTVYTLQIIALAIAAAVRDSSGAIDYPGWPLLIGLIVGSILFASIWRPLLGRGPLERVLAGMTGLGAIPPRAPGSDPNASPIETPAPVVPGSSPERQRKDDPQREGQSPPLS